MDTDSSGQIISLIDYYPYGSVRIEENSGDYENDYKFTGKEKDADTGLYYYEARYYDSSIGRFVSIDPWSGDLTDPQSLNKYAYTQNNPVKYTDPDGRMALCVAAAVVAFFTIENLNVAGAPDGVTPIDTESVDLIEGYANLAMDQHEVPGWTQETLLWGTAALGGIDNLGKKGKRKLFKSQMGEIVEEGSDDIAKKVMKEDDIIFSADLKKSKAKSRSGHRNAGNKQLNESMAQDPKLKNKIEKYDKNAFDNTSTSGKGRKNPNGLEWDHNSYNKNQLDLRTKENHRQKTSSERKGGFSKFWKEED